MSATVTSADFHFVDRAVLGPLQQLAEGLDQVEQRDRQPGIVVLRDERLDLRVRPDVFLDHPLLLQHLGGVLEALVLQQPVHQFLPGIFRLLALVSSAGSRGSSIFDLIWIRVAAM